MSNVTVYPFEGYDIHTDTMQRSNRYATKKWIDRWGFEIAGKGMQVPANDLDEDGLSPIGYIANSKIRDDFQNQVL